MELAHVDGPGPEDPVVLEVLQNPGRPPRHPAHGKQRGEHLRLDPEASVDEAGVEVHVGKNLLRVSEPDQHLALEVLGHPKERLHVGLAPGQGLGQGAQHPGPGVVGLVHPVAEPHDPPLGRKLLLDPAGHVAAVPDLLQHIDHLLVGPAVERALEGRHARAHRQVDVGERRGHHHGGEGARVHAVVRVEDEAHVHDPRLERGGPPAGHHVEQVRGVAQLRVGIQGHEALVDPGDGRGQRGQARDQVVGRLDRAGVVHLLGVPEPAGPAAALEFVDRVGLPPGLRLHRDGVLVRPDDVALDRVALPGVGVGELLAHQVHPEPQGRHGVHVLDRKPHEHPKGFRDPPVLHQPVPKRPELLGRGKLPVEQQVAHLLEVGVGRQVEDVVAPVHEPALGAVDVPHLGLARDRALEPRAHGAGDRPFHPLREPRFGLVGGLGPGPGGGPLDDLGDRVAVMVVHAQLSFGGAPYTPRTQRHSGASAASPSRPRCHEGWRMGRECENAPVSKPRRNIRQVRGLYQLVPKNASIPRV